MHLFHNAETLYINKTCKNIKLIRVQWTLKKKKKTEMIQKYDLYIFKDIE